MEQGENKVEEGFYEGRLLPRRREGLEVTEQIYDGQPYWVVKDRLSLRYFRFDRQEYFILEQLGRGVTLGELKEAHREEFRSDSLSNSELGQFISDLTAKNLLMMDHPDRDELLYESRKRRWRAKLKVQLTNYLFFRIPLYDPDKLFDRMLPFCRFFWTRAFALFYTVLLMVAFVLVVNRWNDFTMMFSTQLLTLYNLPILIGVIWLIKGFHEFGHGMTCKHYGGEVHELGWLFLVFTPFFYCNVTDSWTFTRKSQRVMVTAAGVLTELIFASFAAVVWYFTEQPGFVHTLAFNVLVACSVSTVLFNMNPLLKFDGYYIMMDLLEVPNLRQRASEFVRNLFIRYILGGYSEKLVEEHRFRFTFPLYSFAAYIYKWFILIVIMFVVYRILEQVHLVWLGRGLVAFSILTMILYPMAQMGIMIGKRRQEYGISNIRLLILLAGLVGLFLVVLVWPMQHHVTLNFILEPVKMTYLRSEVAGEVDWSDKIGENVWLDSQSEREVIVAHLTNAELFYEHKQLEARIEQSDIQLFELKKRGTAAEIKQMRDQVAMQKRQLGRLQEQIDNLEVKVPLSGWVLSREIDLRNLQGRYLPRGAALLLIGDTRELQANVWVPEKMYARIFRYPDHLNQETELMCYAFPKEKFRGTVSAVSRQREENMGEFREKMALSHKVGGEVMTELDPLTETERPIEAVYEVTVTLDQQQLPVSARPYMSGRVRIDCGRSTLFQWGRDSLLRFISPEVRL